ncbi:hypothetical protein SDC9_86998 [bioreactor metagenome]|uniref:Uncharacterized protein n=1 Tax=bioreactor metagenome TaxID=1076179 RepID=A0A644ZJ48_9ZZZZ
MEQPGDLHLAVHRRGQEAADPVVDLQAGTDRHQREQDQRHPHHRRRLVRMLVVAPALLAEEGHHHQPGHVEAGDPGAEQRQHPDHRVEVERGLDDVVLRVEAGEEREADDRQIAHREGEEGDPHRLGQAAVVAHVDVVVHAVHDRARPEEHVGLEEAVGEQVEDRERVAGRADARSQHHVADLRHGRAGQHLLDVVLGRPDPGAGEQGDRADDDDHGRGDLRHRVDRAGADHQVDTGGDHRRGVDQGGDRGRALHGVEQPGLQRHLGRLGAGTDQQQDAEQGGDRRGHLRRAGVDRVVRGRTEQRDHQHQRDRHRHVTDPVHHERLGGGLRRPWPLLPEADQQVGRQTDALPAEEQQQVVVRQHQDQHRRDEQVQVGEEPAPVGVVGHVADRVDVDQRPDTGDQQGEQDRQLVDPQPEARRPAARVDPFVQRGAHHALVRRTQQHLGEQAGGDRERPDRHQGGQVVAPLVGHPSEDEQQQGTERGGGDHRPAPGEHSLGRDRGDQFKRNHRRAPQNFSRLASSTEAERRVRYMDTMIARPTTTSQAATTITNSAPTCPSRTPQ